MNESGKDILTCSNCGASCNKRHITRSCGNCFACMACEIYICPDCGEDIVVRPYEKRTRRYRQ